MSDYLNLFEILYTDIITRKEKSYMHVGWSTEKEARDEINRLKKRRSEYDGTNEQIINRINGGMVSYAYLRGINWIIKPIKVRKANS